MGFRKGAYATVWAAEKGSGNYTDVRLSISKKNKQTDKYETDFSGFVRFVGTAHQNVGSLKERDRIRIGDCEVTNSYNKEKNVTYTNYAVFSFEKVDNNGVQGKSDDKAFTNSHDEIDDAELPFS